VARVVNTSHSADIQEIDLYLFCCSPSVIFKVCSSLPAFSSTENHLLAVGRKNNVRVKVVRTRQVTLLQKHFALAAAPWQNTFTNCYFRAAPLIVAAVCE